MDYNSASVDFIFPHWKQINDPKFKLYAFQGQKEGENKEILTLINLLLDCPDCEDSNIFFNALRKIAKKVGREKAYNLIKEYSNFSSEIPLEPNKTLEKEMPIEGNFSTYKEAKGFYNNLMKILGGLNTYEYENNITINNISISYKVQIFLKKDKKDFHIYAVSSPQSGYSGPTGNEINGFYFMNKGKVEDNIVAKFFFKSKKDLFLVWNFYYQSVEEQTKKETILNYDKRNHTNFYKITGQKKYYIICFFYLFNGKIRKILSY